MNVEKMFAPRGEMFGLHGDDFEFSNWQEVWIAVNTEGHPLTRSANWIMSRRRFVRPSRSEKIRIAFDVDPPIVETVMPRMVGWGANMIFCLAVWVALLATTFL